MLPVVPEIIEKTQSQIAVQPMVLVIVWADNGAEDRLLTSYRLGGTNDVAAALDTNVALNPAGEITISSGPAVGLDVSTAASTTPQKSKTWQAVITDVWQMVWA